MFIKWLYLYLFCIFSVFISTNEHCIIMVNIFKYSYLLREQPSEYPCVVISVQNWSTIHVEKLKTFTISAIISVTGEFLYTTSSSTSRSVSRSTTFLTLWRPVFSLRHWNLTWRSSVCVCVCVCVCERRCVVVFIPTGWRGAWQWEWPLAKKAQTSKWIHRFAQDLVERLVMSQRTADELFRPTGKRGRGSGSGL